MPMFRLIKLLEATNDTVLKKSYKYCHALILMEGGRSLVAIMSPPRTSPIEKARNEIANKITVAGVKEALEEKIFLILIMFRIALLAFLGIMIYQVYGIVRVWALHHYIDDVEDITNEETIAMPNVTVCAEIYINETYVQKNISIPDKVLERYRNETGKNASDLLHQLAFFLARTSRRRTFNQTTKRYFWKLFEANPQLYDYATYLRSALPACENMLFNCTFDGKPFDCCKNAWQMVDDGGVCYQLGVSFPVPCILSIFTSELPF